MQERIFYRQSGDFCSVFEYRGGDAIFGLSGVKNTKFSIESGKFFVNDFFVDSISDNDSIGVKVCANNSDTTVYVNNFPCWHEEQGADYDRVYFSGDPDSFFSESVKGIRNLPNLSFVGWSGSTGIFALENTGGGQLIIPNLNVSGFPCNIISQKTGISINPYSDFSIQIEREDNASGSGLFAFFMPNSNLGDINLSTNVELEEFQKSGYLYLSSSGSIYGNSGEVTFFVNNTDSQSKNVEIFLDYVNGSGASYAKAVSSGLFPFSVNEIINGSKNFNVDYSGTFSGVGGRNSTPFEHYSEGNTNIIVYNEGTVTTSQFLKLYADFSGEAVYIERQIEFSGLAESGICNFEEYPFESGVSRARKVSDNRWISVDNSLIFNGEFIASAPLIKLNESDISFVAYSQGQVLEGNRDFEDFWDVEIFDGEDVFVFSSDPEEYIHNGYMGKSSQFYTVPPNGSLSGKIKYFSNYQNDYPKPISSLRVIEDSITYSTSIFS